MPIAPEIIGELLENRAPALALYARQLCADPDDVVQRAFIKLTEQRVVPENPVAWLFKVVRNEALMVARSGKRRTHHEHESARRRAEYFECSQDDAIDSSTIQEALGVLTEQQREILTSHIWGALSFEEIGALIGVSGSTAHRRYQQALEMLRKEIGESCRND